MDLTEEEETLISIDDTVVTEGVEEVIKELGVARKLIAGKPPSAKILKRILSEAWKLRREFDVQITRDNIIRLQLYCFEDKNKVLFGGPWHLERQLLIFKEVPPDLDMKRLDFSMADFWVRIRELPLKMRNAQMAEKMGAMFGSFIRWDELYSGVNSDYMRIRVSIPVTKPLRRVVKLQGKDGPISYRVGYERLPIFCFKCGVFRHLKKSCPKQLEEANAKEDSYGPCLREDSPLKKLSLKEKGKSQLLAKLWEEVQAERNSKQKLLEMQKGVEEQTEELTKDLLTIKVNDILTNSSLGGNEEEIRGKPDPNGSIQKGADLLTTVETNNGPGAERNHVTQEKNTAASALEGKGGKRLDRKTPLTAQRKEGKLDMGK
ncbi:unnamed protein product [Linum trigynum]|uniref:CCHC-type domain-containing protein n=1 Tax=Linum trigynum TaxID=586398 RepID=A0AAV2CGT6_9ROSI